MLEIAVARLGNLVGVCADRLSPVIRNVPLPTQCNEADPEPVSELARTLRMRRLEINAAAAKLDELLQLLAL
jgi:hypothetical protein